jgi:hypothetical protein
MSIATSGPMISWTSPPAEVLAGAGDDDSVDVLASEARKMSRSSA